MLNKGLGEEWRTQFTSLTKQDLILESSCFNDKLINPKRCAQVLTKLIYLFDKGESFSDDELSTLFFAITKLFQSEDPTLKHILYVALKYMRHTSVFCMVTNCINKDVISPNENIRAIALRLLPLIVESQNPMQLERTLKNCLVNKNPLIVEGALHACCEIINVMNDVVRKCTDEIAQLLLNSKDHNIQFKSFILVQTLKANDPVSFVKTLSAIVSGQQNYGELCLVYVVKSVSEVLTHESGLDKKSAGLFARFLEEAVQNDSKSVSLEAARALIALPGTDNKQLKPVVERLRDFLDDSDDVYRYAVLRVFNGLVKNTMRLSLFHNFEQIRGLLSSGNKAVVSLAISILVKIANPEDLERLLDQIYDLIDDLPAFVRSEVIDSALLAVRKNPKTVDSVFKFFTKSLKDKGSTEFRVSLAKALNSISEIGEEYTVRVLEFLSEYIEDSQHKDITLSMLQSIGKLLLRVSNPQHYFKYLINRLTLDAPAVVVATISCLGQVALKRPSIRRDVLMILQPFRNASQCDEARAISDYYINKIGESTRDTETESDKPLAAVEDMGFVIDATQLDAILDKLDETIRNDKFDTSFIDFSKLRDHAKRSKPVEPSYRPVDDKSTSRGDTLIRTPSRQIQKTESAAGLLNYKPSKSDAFISAESHLNSTPEFSFLGDLMVVSDPVNLSESSADIYVRLRKLMFQDHVTLEFEVTNNTENSLSKLHIDLEFDSENLQRNRTIGPDTVRPADKETFYVVFKKEDAYLVSADFAAKLTFTVSVTERGEVVNSYEDEFILENFELKTSDFVVKFPFEISVEDFNGLSDEIKGVKGQTQNYRLDFKTIDHAIAELLKIYGMNPCGQSNVVDGGKNYHTLFMVGRYLDRFPVLVHCQIGIDASRKCVISVNAKASNEALAAAFCDL